MTVVVQIENAKPAAEANPARVGVLLVNLGTPDTADARGVRIYLKEFLSDPRVIEDQGLIWKLILNGIILRIRPRKKARDYRKIWNSERDESPLKTITRAQSEKLARSIADRDHVEVDWAMRYGNPSIGAGIEALMARGLRPDSGGAALSAIFGGDLGDSLRRGVPGARRDARAADTAGDAALLRRPGLHRGLAVSINAHLATLSFKPELIVASFHGMPKAYVDKGDPYLAHCIATTSALRERLGLDASKLLLTFQSRFGNAEWLQPYTDKTIEQLAKDGVRRIAVVMPGFAADCLETLEEIAQENAELFRHNGGEAIFGNPLPERQRTRHGRHPPARAA